MSGVERVALGMRVKSGFAIGVVVAPPVASPRVIDRVSLDLSDPDQPELRQPYHAGMGRLEENARLIATRTRAIERTTAHNVRAWLRRLDADGYAARRVGLVVGSVIDPSTVGSPHIRAHAFEGQLFRSVLERAFEEHALQSVIFVERRIFADAVATLHHPEPDIRATLTEIGKSAKDAHDPKESKNAKSANAWPWRADEKLAALAAWLMLA